MIRGHKRVLTRTRQPNATRRGYLTTSWLAECECGWRAVQRRHSRIEAIADHKMHQAEEIHVRQLR